MRREVYCQNMVSMQDAVFNMGMTTLVIQALVEGDLMMLGEVMKDRLHQSNRLKLIPGAEEAIQAAKNKGAVAAALVRCWTVNHCFRLGGYAGGGRSDGRRFQRSRFVHAVILPTGHGTRCMGGAKGRR